jgi:hypothetical protein
MSIPRLIDIPASIDVDLDADLLKLLPRDTLTVLARGRPLDSIELLLELLLDARGLSMLSFFRKRLALS